MLSTQPKSIADKPWLDPDAKPQIVIECINKTFGGFTAVDSVNLRIYKGEMFALVGASGCGKTTLLRMLAGFATPSAGRILGPYAWSRPSRNRLPTSRGSIPTRSRK